MTGDDVFDLFEPRLDSVNLSKCAFAVRTVSFCERWTAPSRCDPNTSSHGGSGALVSVGGQKIIQLFS